MPLERFEDYAIQVDVHQESWVEFTVSEIMGEELPGGAWLYEIPDLSTSQDVTVEFGGARRFLTGSVKIDGCSNWQFHTENIMAHFCSRKQAGGVGRLLEHLYQITKEKLNGGDLLD